MIVVLNEDAARAALAKGMLSCPACPARLGPWGSARTRAVRQADGPHSVRPARARCRGCGVTHVLIPVACPPRSGYGLSIVGTALLSHAAQGLGHRPIAAGLQIPEETVRRWLRQARRSVDRIRRRAAGALFHIDPDMFGRLAPLRSALADALNMLFAAAVATARRHRLESVCLWRIAAMICGGHFLADARAD
ncbi:hypothetical protein GCM10009555_016970 [Acrocarpospora macrocephala]|uniref:Uncharacterized protein n=1 Tax=Acrocarpospora macrocephala TaxID=150177 RepID=A0A5M3WE68_9ACTN|nr:helix-turn-helix domain-containing protein [Acrocarpospora macrocephala]GES07357.1 hypothetical protein Amac_009520 [Acrocarpospora macrocephala]